MLKRLPLIVIGLALIANVPRAGLIGLLLPFGLLLYPVAALIIAVAALWWMFVLFAVWLLWRWYIGHLPERVRRPLAAIARWRPWRP